MASATANFTSTPPSLARRSAVISAVGKMSSPVTLNPLLGQVDGVVAEPTADIENVAVDPAALFMPVDDVLLGRLVIPRRRRYRRDALGRALTAV